MKSETGRFNFMGHSYFFLIGSIFLTVVGLGIILTQGFRFGIDFAGGNEIQIQFQDQAPPVSQIREFLKTEGFEEALVQSFGEENEVLIRLKEEKLRNINQLSKQIKEQWPQLEIRRVDSVGPQIGEELKKKGLLALCYSLLLILIYLGLRFDYNYAPSAVFCLFHDTILTMAIFSLFGREVNVQTLPLYWPIIGYSLNDTIVTFDRIRENLNIYGKKETFSNVCNRSLNDVLSRTLLTSITTMIAVSSMWFLAQGVIKDFAFTLGVGVVIGTYSSIYVAVPLTVFFQKFKKA